MAIRRQVTGLTVASMTTSSRPTLFDLEWYSPQGSSCPVSPEVRALMLICLGSLWLHSQLLHTEVEHSCTQPTAGVLRSWWDISWGNGLEFWPHQLAVTEATGFCLGHVGKSVRLYLNLPQCMFILNVSNSPCCRASFTPGKLQLY